MLDDGSGNQQDNRRTDADEGLLRAAFFVVMVVAVLFVFMLMVMMVPMMILMFVLMMLMAATVRMFMLMLVAMAMLSIVFFHNSEVFLPQRYALSTVTPITIC